MTKELRRCPFCGGEVKTCDIPLDANTISHQFNCSNCGMVAYFDYLDEEESIEAWNRREPLEDIVEQLEELSKYEVVENKFKKAIEIVKSGGIE